MARAPTTRSRSPEAQADDAVVDPALPQKKQARHRLIGALTLCLAAAVVVPLVLEPEPTRSPADVAVVIPSRDTPLPFRATSGAVDAGKAGVDAARRARMAPETALPAPPPADAPPVLERSGEARPTDARPAESSATPSRTEVKSGLAQPGSRTEPKADVKADAKSDTKSDTKGDGKTQARPETPGDAKSESRAQAKAESQAAPRADSKADSKADTKSDVRADTRPDSRSAPKVEPKKTAPADEIEKLVDGTKARPAAPANRKYALQVGAFTAESGASAAVDKLRAAGVRAYTERITTDRGERIRVRAGPFPSREAADEARDKLKAAGVTTALIPQ